MLNLYRRIDHALLYTCKLFAATCKPINRSISVRSTWLSRVTDFDAKLTLWRSLLPYGHSYKASCARTSYAVICNFWHPGTLTLTAEHQSARMSKITNDGLTRSGTGWVQLYPYGNSGFQRVNIADNCTAAASSHQASSPETGTAADITACVKISACNGTNEVDRSTWPTEQWCTPDVEISRQMFASLPGRNCLELVCS